MSDLWELIKQSFLMNPFRHITNTGTMGTGVGIPSSDPLIELLKLIAVLASIIVSVYLVRKTQGELKNIKLQREISLKELEILDRKLDAQ